MLDVNTSTPFLFRDMFGFECRWALILDSIDSGKVTDIIAFMMIDSFASPFV